MYIYITLYNGDLCTPDNIQFTSNNVVKWCNIVDFSHQERGVDDFVSAPHIGISPKYFMEIPSGKLT
jgi:hypothetical protein